MLRKTWKFLIMWFLSVFVMPYSVLAQDLEVDGFNIMPELTDAEIGQINTKITRIWSEWWQVWKHYTDEAAQLTTSQQIASWIMNWDTLLNYVVYLMRFLNQIGILIGAIMILYAGYLYATSVFKLWDVNKAKNAIASAIKGVLIIVFSYAIWRALWMFFL